MRCIRGLTILGRNLAAMDGTSCGRGKVGIHDWLTTCRVIYLVTVNRRINAPGTCFKLGIRLEARIDIHGTSRNPIVLTATPFLHEIQWMDLENVRSDLEEKKPVSLILNYNDCTINWGREASVFFGKQSPNIFARSKIFFPVRTNCR